MNKKLLLQFLEGGHMKKNKYFSLLIAFVALLLILVGCGNNTLDTPKNISVDINNRLSWDKVTNARSYELEIKSSICNLIPG